MAKRQGKEKSKTTRKRVTPKVINAPRNDRSASQAVQEEQGETLEMTSRREIQGILFLALTLLLLFSLITYQADDPTYLGKDSTPQNVAGIIGAIVSDFFFRFFGYVAYAFPLLSFLIALDRFRSTPKAINYRNGIGTFIGILSLCALFSLPAQGSATHFSPGGFLGVAVSSFLVSYLNVFGSVVVIVTGLMSAGLLFKRHLFQPLMQEESTLTQGPEVQTTPRIVRPNPQTKSSSQNRRKSKKLSERLSGSFKKNDAKKRKKKKPKKKEELPPSPPQEGGYQLPPTTLLNLPQSGRTQAGLKENLLKNSKTLEEKLLDFGIEGQVVGVLPGPVITRYEFQPAPGVKVSRIVNLADDLALGMKAVSIRIVAPVPGKDVVGIEVPNKNREIVYMRELLDAKLFHDHSSKLALAVGKDIGGHPYVADLAKMPHLLIAGATGSGKSVCLNTLICSILFHATPEEARFIMIDPKMLELGVYDSIPHLLIPVVKDPQKATNALNWATEEMTRRYGVLAQKGVRNIAQYNDAIQDFKEHQHPNARTKETPLPYIVIIVDELADLMMVSAGVEKPITRLAQMARAVGIHLILATQRPSVDVITGVIKANFPARISFRVSSKVDSRTILDANGAELLLGDGDMLFLLPGTSRIRRLHGSFVTEKEIRKLTNFLKKAAPPQYDQAVLEYNASAKDDELDEEALYRKAVRLVVTHGEASISMLRRALRVGHSRASRLIDTMERDGIVGEFKGSRPRDILITPEQLDARFPEDAGQR